uniref:V-SNARE coiled-coil homology domain-containing protein n=1 Tax=Takifugu rubripes TaxID=31033 RepID=A0A674PFV4_TAKRU
AQNIKNTTGGLERDQKLSELDDRADALQAGLKNKYWWKNCKVANMLGLLVRVNVRRYARRQTFMSSCATLVTQGGILMLKHQQDTIVHPQPDPLG